MNRTCRYFHAGWRSLAMATFLVLAMLASSVVSGVQGAHAQTDAPGAVAANIRSALFDAQTSLLTGDTSQAQAQVQEAVSDAAPLLAAFDVIPEERAALDQALHNAADAAERGDVAELAAARARVITALYRGSYALTLNSVRSGDAESAGRWLLLRDFRPSTRLARPSADATLALQELVSGTLTPDKAAEAIQADLLDTYQAKLDEALAAIRDASTHGFSVKLAEAGALAGGYWAIIAPAYREQFGDEAGTTADTLFRQLGEATLRADLGQITPLYNRAVQISASFRAAPLTEDEQARRAGQLLLYLSLVPVEYGRGVKQGAVLLPIEIEEARTFFDSARAAFVDLRLILKERDATGTDEVANTLDELDHALAATQAGTEVAAPEQISALATRADQRLRGLFPDGWQRHGSTADLDVIRTLLDQMERAAAGGQFKEAESARLEAYALFDAGPEKRLLGFSPGLAHRIERLFWEGDGQHEGLADALARHATGSDLHDTRAALDRAFTEAERLIGTGRPATGAIIFNAATIVFREGLEAVLILASLMASMIGAHRRLKRPLVLGAAGALAISAALFFLAQSVLLSLARYSEKIEAIVSLVAIGVLVLVLNWFFHKVYWTRWIAQHHARRRAIIGGAAGQALGLATLGFTSVFREGAETVLFLQSLVLDAGTWTVIEGTALGLAGVALVGILTFVLQAKLPHKKMLIATGVLIALVLVTMVGNTMHALQAVGWAPITPLGDVSLPVWMNVWLGVFATWEGIVAQGLAIVFVLGSYVLAERVQARARQTRLARASAGASD
ncbi:MAG: iron permease [Thermomicrobiales bacterium]|nr:MAG: iron permease [Thermomicrobiales bacterium]